MKVLLVGEFSRLHNSLKEGLLAQHHEVTLIANGDGFKNFDSDLSHKAAFSKSRFGSIFRQGIFKIFNYDIALLEHGIRFYLKLKKLKGFDVVQLINEAPIQTYPRLELFLLKKLCKQNDKTFLLCSGIDYLTLNHYLSKKERYSILNPYFENLPNAKEQYRFMWEYSKKSHKKIHDYLYQTIAGVIATDLDYVNPLLGNSKFVGMIPNPINTDKLAVLENKITDTIIIFLGINTGNSLSKGIHYFEKALAIIQEKFKNKVEISIVKNIPYQEYIKLYNKAHILLDQVYGYDQGYNALEAMAQGKVVFTGADSEFLHHYNLKEDEVAINALPNVAYLVEKLSWLIENPEVIKTIGTNAKNFIAKEHYYIYSAKKYVAIWEKY